MLYRGEQDMMLSSITRADALVMPSELCIPLLVPLFFVESALLQDDDDSDDENSVIAVRHIEIMLTLLSRRCCFHVVIGGCGGIDPCGTDSNRGPGLQPTRRSQQPASSSPNSAAANGSPRFFSTLPS